MQPPQIPLLSTFIGGKASTKTEKKSLFPLYDDGLGSKKTKDYF